MINDHAVRLAMEYLDRKIAEGECVDLVGMLNHVDYYERVVMTLDEVQEALNQRPAVYLRRVEGRVTFTQSSGDREITEEDLERNVRMYHDEFWAKYRQLEKGNA